MLFSVGNKAVLITLQRPDHRNNEVFVVLFSLLFAPLKVNLPLLPEKRSENFVIDPSKRKEIVCPLLVARAKQAFVSKSLDLQCLVDS